MQPAVLARAAHHEQVALAEQEALCSATGRRAQQERSAGPEGHEGRDGILLVATDAVACQATLSRPSR
jgi:hypothetical protein